MHRRHSPKGVLLAMFLVFSDVPQAVPIILAISGADGVGPSRSAGLSSALGFDTASLSSVRCTGQRFYKPSTWLATGVLPCSDAFRRSRPCNLPAAVEAEHVRQVNRVDRVETPMSRRPMTSFRYFSRRRCFPVVGRCAPSSSRV